MLSFSYIENGLEAVDGELGDIAISLETAKKQAGEAGHDLTDEVALLALHGVLHIIGHDHQTEKDQQIMDQLQSLVLQQAGLTYRDFRWE